MKPLHPLYFCLVTFILLVGITSPSGHAAPAENDPSTVTKELYAVAARNLGFDVDIVKAEKPWLTPDLYSRMMKKAMQPVPKGDAPDIEGDLFFNSQEMPTKYEIGHATIDQSTAKVPVTIHIGLGKYTVTVHLTQMNETWLVDDVDYGKDGKLTDLLK